ncbi:hypothetical protein [Shimazuella kribbensis]|uniref:hypothetical protein n=1 Tax=Shimazuella kribbensis TaxID=139808 RepID=UPI00048AA117|nr:hypothetical protein [Shimazuella kribbensis]
MKKWMILFGCFSFLLIGGCSFSKDIPCGCLPPNQQKKEQQNNTLELQGVVWNTTKIEFS